MSETSPDLKKYMDHVQKSYINGCKEPSTIEEFIGMHLYKSAMWPDEIVAIVDNMKTGDDPDLYGMCWSVPLDGYPTEMAAVLCLLAERKAMSWLEEHKPMHIALEMLKMKKEMTRDPTSKPSTE